LADGDTNNEIAAELVVSVHTVERHLQNAYRKIGVRNRADAAAYMVRAALNPPEIGITVPVHIPVPDGTDRTAHPGQDSVQPGWEEVGLRALEQLAVEEDVGFFVVERDEAGDGLQLTGGQVV
jgi:hypothetical protein